MEYKKLTFNKKRNPGAHTIEPILENALVQVGAIDEYNSGSFTKVGWDRCARTDKGVSAASNMITLKICYVEITHDNIMLTLTLHKIST